MFRYNCKLNYYQSPVCFFFANQLVSVNILCALWIKKSQAMSRLKLKPFPRPVWNWQPRKYHSPWLSPDQPCWRYFHLLVLSFIVEFCSGTNNTHWWCLMFYSGTKTAFGTVVYHWKWCLLLYSVKLYRPFQKTMEIWFGFFQRLDFTSGEVWQRCFSFSSVTDTAGLGVILFYFSKYHWYRWPRCYTVLLFQMSLIQPGRVL